MKKSTVIVIIAAIVALTVVYSIQQIGKSRRKAIPAGEFVKILPQDMRAADIHKIEVYRGDAKSDAIILARSKEGWNVPSRFNSKGKEEIINDLLDDIKKLEGGLRTKKKSLHEDFDITDEKAVHIALYKEDGKLYRNLLLGKKGERWGEGFVRLANSNEVYLADKNLLSTLGIYSEDSKLDTKKWLDLNILDEKSDEIAKVVLDMPGKQVVLEKKEKKKEEPEEEEPEEEKPAEPEEKKEYEWVLVKPELEFKLKDSAVKSLVSSVSQFRGEDVADPAKMDEYGFDSPTYSATVTLDDETSATILVGAKTGEDKKRYARLKDGNTVYVLSRYTITGVFKKMRELVDIEIWDLKKEDVASISLQKPEYEILLEHRPKKGIEAKEPKDYEWVLVKPETRFKLKDFRITNILGKAAKPSPQDLFVTGDLQSYGLEAPEFKAIVKMKDDSAHALHFGKKLEDSEDRYVKFEGKDHVYSFTEYNFGDLFPTLPKLLTIGIMEDLEKDEIASLNYHTADEKFVLSRKEETGEPDKKKWSLKTDEEHAEAKSNVIDDILDAITAIQPEDMVIGKSDADCGLDKPADSLTISTKKAPDRYVLLFGKKVSEESADRYFKVKNEPEIFILSEEKFGDIFRKVKDLKVKEPPKPKEEKKPPAEEKPPTPPTPEEAVLPEQKPAPPKEAPKEVPEKKEEKPAAPEQKPLPPKEEPKAAPEEKEEKPESAAPEKAPAVKQEKAEPPAPEKKTPSEPEPEASPTPQPEAEKEKPAPQPPLEKPSLRKPEEEIPLPPLPKPPAPQEPIPLPLPPGEGQ